MKDSIRRTPSPNSRKGKKKDIYVYLFCTTCQLRGCKTDARNYYEVKFFISLLIIFYVFSDSLIIHFLYQSLRFLIPAILFLQVAPNFSVKRS